MRLRKEERNVLAQILFLSSFALIAIGVCIAKCFMHYGLFTYMRFRMIWFDVVVLLSRACLALRDVVKLIVVSVVACCGTELALHKCKIGDNLIIAN